MFAHRKLAAVSVLVAAALCSARAADLSSRDSALFLLGSSALPGQSGSSDITALASGDFNCDGNVDIAVGSPLSTVSGSRSAGSVSIGFGNPLIALRSGGQLISQDSGGVGGAAEVDDSFGFALAAADTNSDGCDDLAVGIPGEDVGNPVIENAGGVAMFKGSLSGLDLANDIFLPPTASSAPHGPAGGHVKGAALAFLDHFTSASALPALAIGTPGHSSGAALGAGGVSIRRSSSVVGDLGTPLAFIERNQISGDFGRMSDSVGERLAAGDFDNDGFSDLVAAGDHLSGCPVTIPNSLCLQYNGHLVVSYGAGSASNIGHELVSQDSPGVPGVPQLEAQFGAAFAVGDFDGDGIDDLAVGAPRQSVSGKSDAGTVTVLFGGTGGLLAQADRSIVLTINSIFGLSAADGDEFGSALAAGDFDLDGVDDLVIGVPGKQVGSRLRAGMVIHIPSAVFASAPTVNAGVYFLGGPGMPGTAGTQDRYGSALAVGDFNADELPDLAVAVPGRRNGSGQQKGAVNLLFSSSDTVTGIVLISPAAAAPGESYRIRVINRRTPTVGDIRARGSVQVSASDGSSCMATLSVNSGLGSCTLDAPGPGILTITATYPGQLGFRSSSATPVSYAVEESPTDVFTSGFE